MICQKCKAESSVILRKKDTYCDDCFVTGVNHKFRSCLGKNRVLSRDENVLVCLSGGVASTVLLNLVHSGEALDTHKKLRIQPVCLYLTGLLPDYEKDLDIAKKLIERCNVYNYSIYVIDISSFKHNLENLPPVNTIPEGCKKTQKSPGLSQTEYNDYTTKVIRNVFIKVAKFLKCTKIFCGETTTTLARNLLSNIALGRGSQVEHDVGFADNRDEQVQILRPMKDISMEELNYYVKIKELSPAQLQEQSDVSMQSLIKSFVVDLQENFPATISTVCKTADKIGTHDNSVKHDICIFCQSDLNVSRSKLTSLEATNFSQALCMGLKSDCIDGTDKMNKFCYTCRRYNKMIERI